MGKQLGFIGLGKMGAPMAGRLLDAGYALTVFDTREAALAPFVARGATKANSPAAVASAVDTVLVSLPTPDVVRQVALGDDGIAAGTNVRTFVDLSTTGPRAAQDIAAQLAGKNITTVDSPVSGGPRGAESRKLALWIGGDEDVFQKFKPVIDAIGDQPYYVGPIGAGSIAKLVHNCAGYMIQTALAEVFTMGVKAGVDPLAIFKAVRQGARGRARTFDPLGDNFLQGKFDPPAFALRLAYKDVSLAVALGRENKVPMRMANMTLEEMTEALNRGWGERDSRVAMLLQEERAGVDIKVPAAAIKEVLDGDKS